MTKLTRYDRNFLAACKISADPPRYSDFSFLKACGVDPRLTPEEFQSENKHRDITPCRGCGAKTFEQHTQDCRHRALDGTEQLDGTQQLLAECGLDPYNRADYLLIGFAGTPPDELDGEVEAMLPDGIRLEGDDEEDEEEN